MKIFVDTNVLLYSAGSGATEISKRETARTVLDGQDCAMSVQVLQEFYVQATRATRPHALTHAQAKRFIDNWRRFPIISMTTSLHDKALSLRADTNFAYWDCAIIAAAVAGGCNVLYTEDMQNGREIAGVKIVNPFLEAA